MMWFLLWDGENNLLLAYKLPMAANAGGAEAEDGGGINSLSRFLGDGALD